MKLRVIITLLTVVMLYSVSFSQNKNYFGDEEDITAVELQQKAENTIFEGQIIKEIYSDKKNTYFALDNSSIDSKYVKIRILEQTYKDKALVSLSSDIDNGYMMFLVNNTLNKSQDDITKLFETFRKIALKEEASMNEEAMNQWLDNHKKFLKK